ncbi:TIGR02996 domain-containing protein [bacterium]|nr:TIGR02996 domain-containing protein [bacterium]
MTDRDALYAAVLAAPDDDTPRLVYADYLDDTGNRADAIRGRFIRNQVALARAEPWSKEYDRLSRATAPVEFHYAKEWATGMEGVVLAAGNSFVRGFLGQVTCYSKKFVSDGAKLFAAHPIRAVKFAAMTSTRGAAPAADLAASPLLARVHTLYLNGGAVDDWYVGVVAASPNVAALRSLSLEAAVVGRDGIGRIGSDGYFPGVRELTLWNTVNENNTAALTGSRSLARLEVLSVARAGLKIGPPLRGPGAVALAESPHLRGLTELELYGQELRKRGAEAFAAAYSWPGLRRLSLRGNEIPGSAIPAFAANPHLRSLRTIDFRFNDIKAGDLVPLRRALPETRLLTDDTEHPIRLVLLPEDQP